MLQMVETRLVVQRDNTTKDKYYPKVVSATAESSYPFSIPTATIDIITNIEGSTAGYISPVRVDDIVRLQVSTKMNPKEKTVWEDIFEGRVRDITSSFEDRNTSSLFCVGHIGETAYKIIDQSASWTSDDAGPIIQETLDLFIERLTYLSGFIESGAIIDYMNEEANQKYVADLFGDIEKLTKLHYYFSVVPTYDTNGNLSACYIRWKHFPTKMTNKYAVIEGTERYLGAEFKSSAEELWNFFRVCGETVEATDYEAEFQYTGAAKSSISIAKYSKRCKVLSVSGITSNYMCANIAASMVQRFKNPIVSGTATILGTPRAKIGDLVHVKIPSLEVNGAYVDRNYHVYKVEHSIDSSGFTTTLDFTKVKKTPEDYIADFQKQNRLNNSADVNTDAATSSSSDQDGVTETSDTSDYGDTGYTDTSTWEDNIDYSEDY
jgi:hypothetical protein